MSKGRSTAKGDGGEAGGIRCRYCNQMIQGDEFGWRGVKTGSGYCNGDGGQEHEAVLYG